MVLAQRRTDWQIAARSTHCACTRFTPVSGIGDGAAAWESPETEAAERNVAEIRGAIATSPHYSQKLVSSFPDNDLRHDGDVWPEGWQGLVYLNALPLRRPWLAVAVVLEGNAVAGTGDLGSMGSTRFRAHSSLIKREEKYHE